MAGNAGGIDVTRPASVVKSSGKAKLVTFVGLVGLALAFGVAQVVANKVSAAGAAGLKRVTGGPAAEQQGAWGELGGA